MKCDTLVGGVAVICVSVCWRDCRQFVTDMKVLLVFTDSVVLLVYYDD